MVTNQVWAGGKSGRPKSLFCRHSNSRMMNTNHSNTPPSKRLLFLWYINDSVIFLEDLAVLVYLLLIEPLLQL